MISEPKIERRKLSELKPAKYNPRKIDPAAMAGLEASLKRFGYVEPIVVNGRSGNIVGGHQRYKVLKSQGIKESSVVVVDLDDIDEKALNVALNNPHTSGEFNADLQGILEEVLASNDAMFNELRFSELLGTVEQLAPTGDPDHAPEPPKEAKAKPGDLYILGRHRLLCGDSTSADAVSKVLGGLTVDSMVTDPPYGVDYGEKNQYLNEYSKINPKAKATRIEKRIASDMAEDYRAWFASFLSIIQWSEHCTFYIFMSNAEMHNLRLAIEDCGLTWGDYLLWLKNGPVFGRKDYSSKFELIVYGWAERHRFYGSPSSSSVLQYDKPRKNDLHPTMKPVDLVKQLIEDGSQSGAVIYEPFCGSGTTLIASEITGRQCRAIELDPLYCDVIVKRWEDYTGKKAELWADQKAPPKN